MAPGAKGGNHSSAPDQLTKETTIVNAWPNHPALRDLDPSTRFLYTPHTITCLFFGT